MVAGTFICGGCSAPLQADVACATLCSRFMHRIYTVLGCSQHVSNMNSLLAVSARLPMAACPALPCPLNANHEACTPACPGGGCPRLAGQAGNFMPLLWPPTLGGLACPISD